MKVYRFPTTGPTSPIFNPLNPYLTQWWPFQVYMASFNNNVNLIYTDYYSGNFVIKVDFTNDQGVNWS